MQISNLLVFCLASCVFYLTDQAWFWGGSEAQITQTITHGRKAIMPAWGPMLKEKGVTNVANYVKSISDNSLTKPPTI
jgi:mono/diheme cytochrome c family protein